MAQRQRMAKTVTIVSPIQSTQTTRHMIIYHQAGRESAPRLAEHMNIPAMPAENALYMEERPPFLIRWGTSARVRFRAPITVNLRGSLLQYNNRGEQLGILRDEGIRIPDFIEGEGRRIPKRWAHFYARNNIAGRQPTGGRGLSQLAHTGWHLLSEHDLSVKAIYKLRQFRVHVVGANTRIRELMSIGDLPSALGIWNLDSGFTYRVPVNAIPVGVRTQAIAAVSALRLDFGAVDIVYGHNTELRQGPIRAYVIEVNTAPGLSEPTLSWYGDHLNRLVESRKSTTNLPSHQENG